MFDLNKYQGHERLKTGGKYYKWEGPIASGKYVEYEDDDGTSNVPYNTYDYYDWDYHHINQELDAGEYQVDGSFNPHLFFAGKLFRDSTGALTFVNIFTIVLE